MKLRGIDFGSIWISSGFGGFFGEGYWYHRIFRRFWRGFNFQGITFCAKTMTLQPHEGNVALGRDFKPMELFPDCIIVKPWQGAALNAVSLSNPGFMALAERNEWQKRREPFFLSWATIQPTREERKEETEMFIKEASGFFRQLRGRVGLQINVSCPNLFWLEQEEILAEAEERLELLSALNVPLVLKLSALLSPNLVLKVSQNEYCDALCVSNAVPWKSTRDIDWEELFGSEESPLARYGGGGLSGKPLLPLTRKWIKEAREIGITKPINAGGGILSARDLCQLKEAGADSVSLGTAIMIRPWRIKSIAKEAQRLF